MTVARKENRVGGPFKPGHMSRLLNCANPEISYFPHFRNSGNVISDLS